MKQLTFLLLSVLAGLYSFAQQPKFEWAQTFGTSSSTRPTHIKIDDSGYIYTFGRHTGGSADFDPSGGSFLMDGINGLVYVIKSKPNGDFVWAKQIAGTDAYTRGGFVDSAGNVYITGTYFSQGDFDPSPATFTMFPKSQYDMFVCKLDRNGDFVWAKNIGSLGTGSSEYSTAITADRQGSVYVTGYFSGTVDFDPSNVAFNLTGSTFDIFIMKLNASGNFAWAKAITGPNYYDQGLALVANDTSIFIGGTYAGTMDFDPGVGNFPMTSVNTNNEPFVLRLDSAGVFKWAKRLPSSNDAEVDHIHLDKQGNLILSGWHTVQTDFDPGTGTAYLSAGKGTPNYYVLKLTNAGNYVWAKAIGSGNKSIQNWSHGLPAFYTALDTADNIYATGFYGDSSDFDPGPGFHYLRANSNGFNLPGDIFISRINADGSFGWVRGFGDTTFIDNGLGICINKNAEIYTTGVLFDTVDVDPGLGVYFISAPSNQLSVYIHKLSQCIPPDSTITVSSCDSFIINGTTYKASGTYKQNFASATSCDSVFIIQLTIDTVITGVTKTGNTLTSQATGVSYQWLDCNNNYAPIAGQTSQAFIVTANGNYAVLVTKNGCSDTSLCQNISGINVSDILGSHTFRYYPNPVQGKLNIDFDQQQSKIEITLFDFSGKMVLSETFEKCSKIQLNLNCSSGVYFATVRNERMEQAVIKIIKE